MFGERDQRAPSTIGLLSWPCSWQWAWSSSWFSSLKS